MRVRVRRIAKWGCLSLGSVMLIAAVVGFWWNFGYMRWVPRGPSNSQLGAGITAQGIGFTRVSPPMFFPDPGGWVFHRVTTRPPLLVGVIRHQYYTMFVVPMSNLALLTLIPGVVLWRLDRRRAAHECPKCGYDRRGLGEGAVCPECGAG